SRHVSRLFLPSFFLFLGGSCYKEVLSSSIFFSQNATPASSASSGVANICRSRENYFVYRFFAAVALRIIAAHFVASASDSNPKTAEYFLPTTWARRKSMLIPAPAMASAVP